MKRLLTLIVIASIAGHSSTQCMFGAMPGVSKSLVSQAEARQELEAIINGFGTVSAAQVHEQFEKAQRNIRKLDRAGIDTHQLRRQLRTNYQAACARLRVAPQDNNQPAQAVPAPAAIPVFVAPVAPQPVPVAVNAQAERERIRAREERERQAARESADARRAMADRQREALRLQAEREQQEQMRGHAERLEAERRERVERDRQERERQERVARVALEREQAERMMRENRAREERAALDQRNLAQLERQIREIINEVNAAQPGANMDAYVERSRNLVEQAPAIIVQGLELHADVVLAVANANQRFQQQRLQAERDRQQAEAQHRAQNAEHARLVREIRERINALNDINVRVPRDIRVLNNQALERINQLALFGNAGRNVSHMLRNDLAAAFAVATRIEEANQRAIREQRERGAREQQAAVEAMVAREQARREAQAAAAQAERDQNAERDRLVAEIRQELAEMRNNIVNIAPNMTAIRDRMLAKIERLAGARLGDEGHRESILLLNELNNIVALAMPIREANRQAEAAARQQREREAREQQAAEREEALRIERERRIAEREQRRQAQIPVVEEVPAVVHNEPAVVANRAKQEQLKAVIRKAIVDLNNEDAQIDVQAVYASGQQALEDLRKELSPAHQQIAALLEGSLKRAFNGARARIAPVAAAPIVANEQQKELAQAHTRNVMAAVKQLQQAQPGTDIEQIRNNALELVAQVRQSPDKQAAAAMLERTINTAYNAAKERLVRAAQPPVIAERVLTDEEVEQYIYQELLAREDKSIRKFISTKRIDVNRRFDRGNTLLHLAAEYGMDSLADFLLEHGAELTPVNEAKAMPCIVAQQKGHNDIVANMKLYAIKRHLRGAQVRKHDGTMENREHECAVCMRDATNGLQADNYKVACIYCLHPMCDDCSDRQYEYVQLNADYAPNRADFVPQCAICKKNLPPKQ